MIVSSLDFVLVLCAAGGSALVLAGIAQGLGLPVPPFLLTGGGLPLFLAWYWHSRVVAQKEAAYVRQTDAATAVRLATIAPVSVADTDDSGGNDDAELQALRWAVETWFRAGDSLGSFSENSMTGADVCGSDVWPRLAGFYASEVGHQVLRVVPGNVGTNWNYGHNLDSTLLGLASSRIPLPAGNVPDIKPYVRPATQRGAAQKSTARVREVVETTFKDKVT